MKKVFLILVAVFVLSVSFISCEPTDDGTTILQVEDGEIDDDDI